MLENFMQQLAKEFEISGDFATGVPGMYAINLDGNVLIEIAQIPQGFTLNCKVCNCPKSKEEAFYTQAMLANLFGQGTRGAVLGINEEGTLVTLAKLVDYTIDYKEFRDIIEDFINCVDYWKEEAIVYQ